MTCRGCSCATPNGGWKTKRRSSSSGRSSWPPRSAGRTGMRFGLFLLFEWSGPGRSFDAMYGDLLEEIAYAEEQGLETVWLAEHHFVSYSACPQPLKFAIKAATQTRRVRFGTGVLVLPFYHPLRLAGEIAVADVLTGGRLEIGVGRGAYPYEF